ncbi:MAG: ubiquinol-cytochrome c reductase cytochrome c1 subunit, partial [bacterium]
MKKLLLAALLIVSGNAYASGAMHYPQQDWSFNKATSDWEKDTILRGYQVATEVCMSCHSMKYIKHRDLAKVGFTEDEIKRLAANMEMSIGAPFMSSLADEDAAAVYAKILPDLSVMNKARGDGANYVYALLTGYEDAPSDHELPEGASYNRYFAGHNIAMPTPLSDEQVEYIDGTEATVKQMAKDVTYFLQWTAEPELKSRQQLGIFV